MRSLVVSEYDKVAALMEDEKAQDFFISKHEYSVGDVYTVKVENIMPSIDAVFVKLAEGRMGFLHANDIPGTGSLYDRLHPGQKLLVQIIKEPTGKKGPRVNFNISIPGRYFVLTTEHSKISVSRRISENQERDRLKSVANLMKPEEVGLVIRTEASGRSEQELEEDFVNLWEVWKNIQDKHERNNYPGPVHKEQDFLYSTLRDCFNSEIDEIVVDSPQARFRTEQFLKGWTGREVSVNNYDHDSILVKTGLAKEIKNCLSHRADLPSGGYVIIQTTEALTAIDINSGKFTSSSTLRETVRRTNMEAAVEIARQIRLRNIGGMIIIDFIDMSNREDRIAVMQTLESAFRSDKAKPQIGQLTDLCLVEITRKRSGQALSEVFGTECPRCTGTGILFSLRGEQGSSVASSPSNKQSGRQQGGRQQSGGRQQGSRQQSGGRQQQNRQQRGQNRQQGNRPNRDRNDRKFSGNKESSSGTDEQKVDETSSLTSKPYVPKSEASPAKEAPKPKNDSKAKAETSTADEKAKTTKAKANTKAQKDSDALDDDAKGSRVKRVRNSKTLARLRKRKSQQVQDGTGKEDSSEDKAAS